MSPVGILIQNIKIQGNWPDAKDREVVVNKIKSFDKIISLHRIIKRLDDQKNANKKGDKMFKTL